MLRNLLIYRLLLVNVLLVCGAAFAYSQGWVTLIIETDISRISWMIAAGLGATLIAQGLRGVSISRAINYLKTHPSQHENIGPEDRDKAMMKIAWMGDVAGWMFLLGLIGTVVGWFIAMNGLDTSQLSSPDGARRMIGQVLLGLSVALLTTLVGAISGLWVQINRRLLYTAYFNYWCDRIKDSNG